MTAYAIASSRERMPTPCIRSTKIRLLVRSLCDSSSTVRVSANARRTRASKSGGRSALSPPTRPCEIVSRAPVTASITSHRNSRALIM